MRNPKELTIVADKIRRLFPDTRPIMRDEILRTYDSVFDWRCGLLLVIFAGAVTAFIIFAWDKATEPQPRGAARDRDAQSRRLGDLRGDR